MEELQLTKSFIKIPPPSPSSIDSPEGTSSYSNISEHCPSQASTEFSTPLHQNSWFTSNGGNISYFSCNEVEKETENVDNSGLYSKDADEKLEDKSYYNRSKYVGKAKSVRTYRKPMMILSENRTVSLPASRKLTSSCILQDFGMDNQHEVTKGTHHSVGGSMVSACGDDFDVDEANSTSQSVERYFYDFISGIKKNKIETRFEEWKDPKSNELMNNLRRKEAEIDDWELKEITRASMQLKEFEEKFERKRTEALDKLQKKIISVQKAADAKKAIERQSTATKISKFSQVFKKVTAIAKIPRWKSLPHW